MNSYDQIINDLYIGNKNSLDFYKKFSLIVNCTKNDVKFPPNCTNCIRIPVDDTPDESENLFNLINSTNILQKIHTCSGPVLVHCHAGRQRSCAVVACYLVRYYNMTPIQAVEYIKSKRREAFFGSINFATTINKIYKK
jgi:protein-tyrosine phosphatase